MCRCVKMSSYVFRESDVVPFPCWSPVIIGAYFLFSKTGALIKFWWQYDYGKIRVERMGKINDFNALIC